MTREDHWWPIRMVTQGSRKYVVDEKNVVGQRMGKIRVLMERTAAVERYCHLVLRRKKKKEKLNLYELKSCFLFLICFYYISVQASPKIPLWLKIHRFLMLKLETVLQHILAHHSDLIVRLVVSK